MADLDDFFAKKDRKRNKGQKKTEDGSKKETARERPRPRDGEEPRPGEEEEWKEYEETVKDYTGLKIQVLQGAAAGGGSTETGPSGDESTGGQEPSKTKGPWNKAEAPEAAAEEEEKEKPPPRPVRVEPPPAPKASVYKPPSIRHVTAPEPEVRRRPQNRHAPDIHNADYFPELGSSGVKRGGGWNTPTGAQTATRPPAQQRRPLALDNRFTSLQDDS